MPRRMSDCPIEIPHSTPQEIIRMQFPMDNHNDCCPSPPPQPMSSPQNQLTLNLLNNLLQMQGLDNSIVNQQQPTAASPSTSQPTSPSGTTTSSYNPQLLEQQIKLTQLQQLQQLQNQIFQQQVLFFPHFAVSIPL
jgi:hypothetical protein